MKILGGILVAIVLIVGGSWIWVGIYANYQWDNTVLSNWNLSDKSSTLEAKSNYIDKFVSALKTSNLADNDALIYKTADNNCQNNIDAVSTLKGRLDQIKGMDESSFQYQQAIQQITAQEQGEADKLLGNLRGCWQKTHYYWTVWNPFTVTLGVFGLIAMLLIGSFLLS